MSTLWLVLTPLLVTWLPAGYLASRIWNALGLGCDHSSDFSRRACPRNHGRNWDWNRALTTENGPAYFGLGVMLGWSMATLLVYFVVALVVMGLMIDFFKRLGRLCLPPKPR